MKFEKIIDLIQVFANEWCLPGNKVLVLGLYSPEIKSLFEFIDSDTIFVNNVPSDSFDIIADYTDLPFEENSFDLILNFTEYTDLFKFIKRSGRILTRGEILNGVEYYYHSESIFTVI
jgi:hypothetical protein